MEKTMGGLGGRITEQIEREMTEIRKWNKKEKGPSGISVALFVRSISSLRHSPLFLNLFLSLHTVALYIYLYLYETHN